MKEKVAGIYKIVNKTNGKYYVGRSADILSKTHGRWERHKRGLRNGCHFNAHLQRAWNKYGESNFDFVIVETLSPLTLLDTEQGYLDIAKTEPDKSYNSNYDAKGGDISSEARKKISDFRKTFRYTEASKLKISKSLTGRTVDPAVCEKIRHTLMYGNGNCRDKTIYNFVNQNTGETFTGFRRDFVRKYNLHAGNVSMWIRGFNSHIKGWKLH